MPDKREIDSRENIHTAPSPFCPHPDRWHSWDWESSELEVSALIHGLVIGLQPDLCIETGTGFGQTAKAIGEALRSNGHGHLISFEVNPERAEIAREACLGLPVTVEAMKASAYDLAGSPPVDMVFFDSDFEERLREFERYRPHLSPQALCMFHDTAPGHGWDAAGNRDFETRLRLIPGVALMTLPTPRGLTLMQVNR